MKYKKIVCVVIDSFGIGQATDAKEFDDAGADTFGHILEYRPDLKIDNLYQLGLGNLHPNAVSNQSLGYALKMHEASCSKDTMTGHWEMMGIHTTKPFSVNVLNGFVV